MKRVIRTSSITLSDRQLRINADETMGCYLEILAKTQEQVDAMLSWHSRVMMLRLDFRVHDYSDDNRLMSNYIRKIKKRLKRRYGLLRLGHLWAREKGQADRQHYHLALLLDANSVRYPSDIIPLCEEVWQGWDQPKPYTPPNCYQVIHRDDDEGYGEVFYRLSYLAKERGKGHKAPGANDYSTSRVRFNPSRRAA